MANPAARKPSISWMIAELFGNMSDLEYGHPRSTYRSVLFPQPAVRSTRHQCKHHAGSYRSVRFPWIHNNEPVDFQSTNMLLSKNHFAVPLWCPFQTMWWFVEGSGGESQSRTSLWNWSPAKVVFVSVDKDERGKHKRLILLTSSTIC